MSVRTILTWPNRDLRKSSLDVDLLDESNVSIAKDLYDTIKANFGLGIAAPQVGICKKLVVIESKYLPDFTEDPQVSGSVVLINPDLTIIDSTKVRSLESCLSIPGISAEVKRNLSVKINYFDSSGKPMTVEVSGGQSCILQHELDHLNGKLFIDRLPQLSKSRIIKKLKKIRNFKQNIGIDLEEQRKRKIKAKRSKLRSERKRKNKSKKKNK